MAKSRKLSIVVDEKTYNDLMREADSQNLSASELARRSLSMGLWVAEHDKTGDILYQKEGEVVPRHVEFVQK